jgi:hypothetical protein
MTINQSKITSSANGKPIGTMQMYAAEIAPDGWLLCDGSAVSRTSYSGLFSLLGINFGAGDASTTFNLPDMRGRIPVGYASGGHSDVSTLGNNEGITSANVAYRRPKHKHSNNITFNSSLTLPNHTHTINYSNYGHTHSYEHSNTPNNADGGTVTMYDYTIGNTGDASLNLSISNPSSNPAITGSVSVGGTIGISSTTTDSHPYVVLNFIIKT